MHPFVLLLVAVFTPFLLVIVLAGPLYAGMFAAAYLIYDTGAATHPLAAMLDDPLYMTSAYAHLYTFWSTHKTEVSLLHYTAPLLGLPLVGLALATWLTRRLIGALNNWFHSTTTVR